MIEKEQKIKIEELLYGEECQRVAEAQIASFKTSEELFYYLERYNWDDGLNIPNIISDHPKCDMATALALFWFADGISLYQEKDNENIKTKKWFNFCQKILKRILAGHYPIGSNKYDPNLTKTQKYKLKKLGVPNTLITPIN